MRTKKSKLLLQIEGLDGKSKLSDLSTDELNFFNLISLMVDIEYRRKYGGSIDWRNGRGYSKKHNEVLADRLPPTDDARSASSHQREITDYDN